MPLYEYQCEECGVRFERRQQISDEPIRTCPECKGHVRRLIQPVGIVFKGKGFYVTDNRATSSTVSTSGSTTKSEETKTSTEKSSGDSDD